MKKIFIPALLILGVPLVAAELFRINFPDAASLEKFPVWQNKSKVVRSYAPGVVPDATVKGSVKFVVEKGGNHGAESTPVFPAKVKIFAGERYRLRVRLMSPDQLNFSFYMLLDRAPWTRLAKNAGAQVVTEPGKWQTATLEFTADFDVDGSVRSPAFFLGNLAPGRTLYVADAVLEGPDNPPERLFSFSEAPMLNNLSSRKNWSYSAAWKQKNGLRETVSLCGLWDFAPAESDKAPQPAANAEEWAHFIVPGHWRGGNISNFVHTDDGKPVSAFRGIPIREIYHAWYKRTLDVPESWKGDKIELHFNRIDTAGEFFLNGTRLGDSSGFSAEGEGGFDVTGQLRYGEKNEFALRVDTDQNRKGGIMGYVYLKRIPMKHFGSPHVTTSFENRNITLAFRNPAMKSGTLETVIRDAKTGETVFRKNDLAFTGKPLRLDFVTPKLWSPDSPNLYYLDLSLKVDGKVVDAATIRFGFAEMTVRGADYLLNGKKINLFCDTAYSGGYWTVDWKMGPEYLRRELRSMRAMNLNAAYFAADMPKELIDIFDEEGVLLISASLLPYNDHMKLTDEEALAVFRKKIAELKSGDRYDNHPSHAAFLIDVWYNFHSGTTNPEYVGLKNGTKRYPAFDRNGKTVVKTEPDPNLDGERGARKRRLDQIARLYKQSFPGKIVLTGGSGEVGDVYAAHAYHTWGAPFEELRALFRRYGLQRELPIFVGEHNIPYPGSLYSIFNFSAAGADPLSMENFVRYAGNDGYRWRAIYGRRALHDYGPQSVQDSRTDRDRDGSYHITSDLYCELLDRSLNTIIPGWRLSGVNGIGFFGYVLGGHFALAGRSVPRYRELPEDLSRPDFYPEYLPGGASPSGFGEFDAEFRLKPTLATAALLRVSAPVFAEFYETGEDPYGVDHAWFGGDTLRKNLIVINDSGREREFDCRVTLRTENNDVLASFQRRLRIGHGERGTIPVELKLPPVAARRNARLEASVSDRGETVRATLPIELFPRPAALQTVHRLYLCDPEGGVKAYLKQQNAAFEELKSLDHLPESGVVIVGRQGLARNPTVPDFNAAAKRGLNILILEQPLSCSTELMSTRTRHAFLNGSGHPALTGFEDRDFANWRGSVSLADAYEIRPAGHGWSAAGNRNMLASYVFRRPSHGNYLSLLGCGFDLYQTPLLEYRARRGSWIGSQLELVPRLGVDPVATTLFHQLVSYLDNRGVREGETLFFGGAAGEKLLKRLKVRCRQVNTIDAATLAGAETLLISDPDFHALKCAAMEINNFVYEGGKIIYLHTGKEFESVWLPFPLKLATVTSRQALSGPGHADEFWRCGWDNNDLYWHDEFQVPAFDGIPEQANAFTPGVVMDFPHGSGRFTLVSITPDLFDNAPATGKSCRFLSALLTNAAVEIDNESAAYLPKQGSFDKTLDLSTYDWSFALDPENKGVAEKVETGKDGSLFWQSGLIADGAEVKLGVPFEHFLRREYDGYAWYRLHLELPPEFMQAERLYLSFGGIDDFDETYFNGVRIGQTGREVSSWWMAPRLYTIPGKLLKPGKNLIAIRVFDEKGEGGINRLPVILSNRPAVSGQRGWKTPYQEGTRRDYDYNPDPVRQY
ncbi:sugar-binding domain-containing protein [uncultured Victivallis sp.]|uniref:sugar-binding domain-containing protein n=1 Tax=uncultured Victivallis sp. TaxID=354118 RepID=UPI0025D48336|nr:sugar-binding domain-containing protein [uncultured Victivallis sp.]